MISVITITFNNHEELLKTLSSLNEVNNIERIVINGGNDPRTISWLREHSEIVSISEPDEGISNAFSKGARLANGDAITFLNSGDILLNKTYYDEALTILNKSPEIDFVHSNLLFIDNDAGPLKMKPTKKTIGAGMPFFHPTMIVRKSVFQQVGYFKNKFKIAMDYDFVCRLINAKKRGYYLDIQSVVEMDGIGVSSKNEKEALKECHTSLQENNLLTPSNFIMFWKRFFFFRLRTMFKRIGILSILKKIKYHND